jgi:serine/threonine protein kinase
VQRITEHLRALVVGLATATGPVSAIPIVHGEERSWVLARSNATAVDLEENLPTIVECFERHARQTPDALAVVDGDRALTYRADLITLRIEYSESLAQKLLQGPLSLTQWIAVGRCLRRFHDAGVCHADLNAHNILLTPEQVYLIDFDRGTLRKRGWWADTTLVRLYRSLEKVTLLAAPESFSDQDWHSLLAGYRESAGLPQPSMV